MNVQKVYSAVEYFRGLLTGKYSKESKEIPKDTRLHWSAQDKRRQMEIAPDVAKYLQDEKFLNLIDVMKEVGNAHGKYKQKSLLIILWWKQDF